MKRNILRLHLKDAIHRPDDDFTKERQMIQLEAALWNEGWLILPDEVARDIGFWKNAQQSNRPTSGPYGTIIP